nr:hypothetical protein CFP56_02691 [Quercus suber]
MPAPIRQEGFSLTLGVSSQRCLAVKKVSPDLAISPDSDAVRCFTIAKFGNTDTTSLDHPVPMQDVSQ